MIYCPLNRLRAACSYRESQSDFTTAAAAQCLAHTMRADSSVHSPNIANNKAMGDREIVSHCWETGSFYSWSIAVSPFYHSVRRSFGFRGVFTVSWAVQCIVSRSVGVYLPCNNNQHVSRSSTLLLLLSGLYFFTNSPEPFSQVRTLSRVCLSQI